MRARLASLSRPVMTFVICLLIAFAMKMYDKSITEGDNIYEEVVPFEHVDQSTGKKLFDQLCSGCHKLGEGMFIGPDLLELDEVDYSRITTGGGGMPQWGFLGPKNIKELEIYIESLRND